MILQEREILLAPFFSCPRQSQLANYQNLNHINNLRKSTTEFLFTLVVLIGSALSHVAWIPSVVI